MRQDCSAQAVGEPLASPFGQPENRPVSAFNYLESHTACRFVPRPKACTRYLRAFGRSDAGAVDRKTAAWRSITPATQAPPGQSRSAR